MRKDLCAAWMLTPRLPPVNPIIKVRPTTYARPAVKRPSTRNRASTSKLLTNADKFVAPNPHLGAIFAGRP
jgi:hypothetical protein